MIVPALPPDLGQFVEQQIATGKYHSEEELVVDAVRVLRQLAGQQHEFHDAVRQGMEQLHDVNSPNTTTRAWMSFSTA